MKWSFAALRERGDMAAPGCAGVDDYREIAGRGPKPHPRPALPHAPREVATRMTKPAESAAAAADLVENFAALKRVR